MGNRVIQQGYPGILGGMIVKAGMDYVKRKNKRRKGIDIQIFRTARVFLFEPKHKVTRKWNGKSEKVILSLEQLLYETNMQNDINLALIRRKIKDKTEGGKSDASCNDLDFISPVKFQFILGYDAGKLEPGYEE